MIQMRKISLHESSLLNELSSCDDCNSDMSPLEQQGFNELSPLKHKSSRIIQHEDEESESRVMRRNNTFELMNKMEEINQTIKATSNQQLPSSREYLKELVSKQKNRYTLDGFNLDLTYITPKIIAMGFPAESFESLYRNSMSEVQRFLNQRHPSNYLVINLCSERKYKADNFFQLMEFPFDDHQAPPFAMIHKFCLAVQEWLQGGDENRIAAIHCKAGKGRTGVMICSYMLFTKEFNTASDSLRYYSLIRTQDAKGVTIASQIRYVHYYAAALQKGMNFNLPPKILELTKVVLNGIPNMGLFGGCKPIMRIQNNNYDFIAKVYEIKDGMIIFTLMDVVVQGDVLIQFFHSSLVSEEKMFQAWIHTSFVYVYPRVQIINREQLDSVKKDKSLKKYPKNMTLELEFLQNIEVRNRSNCIQI